MSWSKSWFNGYRSIWSNKHCNRSCSSCWSCWSFRVYCYISAYDYPKSSIPSVTFNPIQRIEKCVSASIASIDRCYSLNVRVFWKIMSNLPSNRLINTVLVLFDLSTKVSVPTSSLPISCLLTLFFSIKLCSTVKANEFTSSASSQNDIFIYPSPMVYFPLPTLSNCSNSS